MGSNIGSDSASEADIQEPTNKPTEVSEIPDSDLEDSEHVVSFSANPSKLKGIIEHINADSDDDDQPDDPVDFGEEEEEDEAPPPPQASTLEGGHKDRVNTKDDNDDMEVDADEKKPGTKTLDKKTVSPSKSQKKKATDSGPEKAIKKPSTTAKGKAKVPKKTNRTKKHAPLLTAARKDSSSPKSNKPSPKTQKKSVSKTPGKSYQKPKGKGSLDPLKNSDAKHVVQKTKVVKPKKTIGKTANKGKEKTLLKQKESKKTPVKTFSKKTKTNGKASSESNKVRKGRSPKEQSSKKQRTPNKTMSKKAEEDIEEEQNSGGLDIASEGEASDASSDVDEEEVPHTPMSRLPIIGSLACSSRDPNARALLDHAVQQLGKYRVVDYGPDSDARLHAYIISSSTKRGWGLLQALVSGAPLVSEDWLSSSISAGCWQPMEAFRSDKFGQSPRSITGDDVHSRILEGLRIKVVCDGQDASNVRKLVTLCGARVAETRVDVIINDTEKKIETCTNVTKKWLADSVESGVAVEYQPYLVESG